MHRGHRAILLSARHGGNRHSDRRGTTKGKKGSSGSMLEKGPPPDALASRSTLLQWVGMLMYSLITDCG